MTTTDLVHRPAAPLADKITYAKHLAVSNLLPKQYRDNPANLLFALEYAEALDVSPIHALTSIHVIEGKPSASADLIASLIRRAGHRLRVTGDDTYAEAVLIRADDPEFDFKVRWDLARAKQAGLTGKSVWKSYPAAMLRSRAITEVGRMGAPDALFGVIYTPEELGAEVDAEGEVVEARPVQQRQRPATRSGGAALAAAVAPVPVNMGNPAVGDLAAAEDVMDAEVVDDAPETLDVPTPATPAQRTAVVNAAKAAGFTTQADVLTAVSNVVGREVTGTDQLTADEAEAVVIDLAVPSAA